MSDKRSLSNEVNQLKALVKDTLRYIYPNNLKNWNFGKASAQNVSQQSNAEVAQVEQCKQDRNLAISAVSTEKNNHPLKKESRRNEWELHLPPIDTTNHSATLWQKKLSLHTTVCEPLISVLLVLPEECLSHRLFLENVARVITRTFASAGVVIFSAELFCQSRPTLILAPQTILQKKFPQAQVHCCIKEGHLSLIPLDNLDFYSHDVTSKRALWSAIQHLFQSS